jgi:[DsrC]-trisulfide reductase subunit M
MKMLWSLVAVGAAVALAFVGGGQAGAQLLFGIIVPYAALVVFVVGLVAKVVRWARAPVPFRIPTTSGQQRSLPWIKSSPLDNPYTGLGAAARVALEVVTFRSLFRNTRAVLRGDGKLVYSADKFLWAGALAFHASFLVILLRHLRFFSEPVPRFVILLQGMDGFFQVGVPIIYATDIVLVAALGYLFLRRLANPRLRYLSLPADFFPLLLLLSVAGSGILLRYFFKTDVVAVKELALGLATFHPTVPAGLTPLFFVHLFLVSTLFAYFPFSKLAHMAGVFLSPTRNLANNNRARRHVNPWNPPIVGHTYAEWEEEFHDKLVAAGIPLDGE